MRLLLIEDNQRLADYLGTALQNGGFAIDHVTTTVDAESALSATHYDTSCSISVCPTWTASSGSDTSAAGK